MTSSLTQSRRHLFAASAALATVLATRATRAERWRDRDDHDRDDRRVDHHCFRIGTRLQVPDGMRRVEELCSGDLVSTPFGPMPVVRVHEMRPSGGVVLFTADALVPGIPYQDLYLSAHHCLLLDGKLIAAGNLINGLTILRVTTDSARFYHPEFKCHAVVFAEGVECESLLMFGQKACAPIIPYDPRARARVVSHLRSAFAPVVDLRRPEEVIRDRLAA